MSQERLLSNPNLEHLSGQAHILLPTLPIGRPNSLLPTEETSVSAPMSIRYWRLLNDSGFSSPIANPAPPIISIEVFLDLTHQIDITIGGPASGGDSSSAQKAYARSTVEKRSRSDHDPKITFGSGNEVCPDDNDALVISARVAKPRVKKIMVNMRS
ncbi:hypothetical protein GW17_00049856 [Ensete ventricosum]|uniref:Uncharacterized protein n=1 Tax=Ensete ventricosum TaxID=4639 RepID=A0A444CQD9_ENSVE|nr:hypothetical protein GW17_00049856 [Ensete ventricosum]RZR72888.1 hypothetical protein BHM03_00018317 [Ensete ventricosum]